MVTTADLRIAVQQLGLAGQALCLHVSLRSFGQVAGGAATLVAALLAEGCTVLTPTFTEYGVAPPPARRLARNGWDYDDFSGPFPGVGQIYTPASNAVDPVEMSVVAATVAQMPGRVRGNHPLCSFCAVGPLAHRLIDNQTPTNVNAPLTALVEVGGYVVLMGVGLEKMTLLHLAEEQAGRNLFRRWANGPDGQVIEVTTGGCSDGFGKLEPLLAPLLQEAQVGPSHWRIFPAEPTLTLAAAVIRQNPQITHCGRPSCRCDDAILGGPILIER